MANNVRDTHGKVERTSGWPRRGWLGIGLIAVFWTLNWSLDGLRTHWTFFPLWLGYCLTVDAWVYRRRGTSLWTRSRAHYAGLFAVSAPAWWVFEIINWRTGNWIYEGRGAFSDLEYALLASVSFSTVIPAVFGTAELAGTFSWIATLPERRAFAVERKSRAALIAAGVFMLALTLAWPLYFFPLVWVSLFFIVDPLNDALGHRSLVRQMAAGDWRPALALGVGCLICGFFWELWNVYSFPKWTYRIPFVGFLHVFEMPLLGYGGYIPFALELFALYHLVIGRLSPGAAHWFVRLVPPRSARR